MKKVLVLFAVSFCLVSANYAQTGTDTTRSSHKTMKKSTHRGGRKSDSTNMNSGSSLSPMSNGSGRADSSNSGNGTLTPNQVPGQTQNPIPTQNPSQTPVPSQTPTSPQTPSPTPTPAPHASK